MQPKSDSRLLRDYAEHGANDAFAELVDRHANLVYSAALRHVENPAVATDIAQSVFISLARCACTLATKLAPEASLAGWLCRSARNLSLNHRRDEFRRHTRERHAMEQLAPIPNDAPDWDQLRHVLDDAMSELSDNDYDAIVLRFFEHRDFQAVGAAIGTSDDTAQKRVARALEKLRDLLAQRGIQTTGAALTALISANAVQAAPAGLVIAISTATAAASTPAIASVTTATKTIAMTTLQKTVITGTLAVCAGMGIYETRQASAFEAQLTQLWEQQKPLESEVTALRRERGKLMSQVNSIDIENGQFKKDTTELLRLRGQISGLRADNEELQRKSLAQAARIAELVAATGKPAPHFEHNFLATADCTNQGLNTVDNALQTYLWALHTGNNHTLMDVSTTDENGKLKELSGLATDFVQRLKGIQPLVASFPLKTPVSSIDDITVIHFSVLAETEISTDRGMGINHMPLTLAFKKVDNSWKFDGRVR